MKKIDKKMEQVNLTNKRWQALKNLGIWLIILALAFLFASIVNKVNEKNPQMESNNKEQTNEDIKPSILSYNEKLDNLKTNNYSFVYTINTKLEKYRFEGTYENGVTTGYKQDSNTIIKYKIENGKVYQILIDDIQEIANLYDDIDATLFDLNYLIGLLREVDENNIIITEEESITTYNYNLSQDERALEILVTENKERIESIEITSNGETYHLAFSTI